MICIFLFPLLTDNHPGSLDRIDTQSELMLFKAYEIITTSLYKFPFKSKL